MRKSSHVPECHTGTRGSVPLLSGTYGIGGVRVKPFSCTRDLSDRRAQLSLVRVKPFSCTCDLVERRARLLLDSSYVDHV